MIYIYKKRKIGFLYKVYSIIIWFMNDNIPSNIFIYSD